MRKRQLTDANTDMNQTLELSDKDCKAAIIKILHQSITNSLETDKIQPKK